MKLSDELYSLTDDVPAFVGADPGRAWRTAGRRRRRRRAGAGLALVVVAVLALAGVRSIDGQIDGGPRIGPAGSPSADHVLTLPTRIERPYFLQELPRRAGRLAGVLWSKHQWLAVSPTGHLWRLPLATEQSYLPAVSPDGSTIAFLQDFSEQKHSRLLVWNVTTGVLTFFSQVGMGLLHDGKPVDPQTRFSIQEEAPAYFSPDGSRLVVAGGSMPNPGPNERALLLDLRHGTNVTVLDSPGGTWAAFPAGWLDSHQLVWIDATSQRQQALVATATGQVVRSIHLSMSQARARRGSQWVGPVSADGRHVAFGWGDDTAPGSVLTFSLDRDPSPAVVTAAHGQPASTCPSSWGASAAPAIPQASPTLLTGRDGVVADPRLHVDCAIWASDALRGARHQGLAGALFGLRTAWWTWWWRELALGLALVAGLGVFASLRRQRWNGHVRPRSARRSGPN